MLSLHSLLIIAILAIILYVGHGFLNIKWQSKALYMAIALHALCTLISEYLAWQQPIYHQHIIYLHILLWLTCFGGLLYVLEYKQAYNNYMAYCKLLKQQSKAHKLNQSNQVNQANKKNLQTHTASSLQDLKSAPAFNVVTNINYMYSFKKAVQLSSILVLFWMLYVQSAHYLLFNQINQISQINIINASKINMYGIVLSVHMLALAISYMLVIAIIVHNWLIFYFKRYLQKPMHYQNTKGLQGYAIKYLQQLPSLEYLYHILQQRFIYLILSMLLVLLSGGLLLINQSSSSIKIVLAVFNFMALCLLWFFNKRYGLAQKHMTLMGMAIGSIWLSIHLIFNIS